MSTTTCCIESIMLRLVLPPNTLQQDNSISNSNSQYYTLHNKTALHPEQRRTSPCTTYGSTPFHCHQTE
jgi:hypothetical protein